MGTWHAVMPPTDLEERRLGIMGEVCDDTTFELMRRLGVGEGWRCLEAGAGEGSVARWLSRRVGDAGRVVATDVDPRLLGVADATNVEVLRHDLAADPCPGDPFDLIHARAVLMHLPAREVVLDRLVSWLRPGGWLVVEDPYVLPALFGPPVLAHTWAATTRIMTERVGTDCAWALTYPGPLRSRGLADVGASVWVPPTTPRPGMPAERAKAATMLDFVLLTLEQLRPGMLEAELVPESDIDECARLLRTQDPSVTTYGFGMVSAWGRGSSM